MIDGAKLDLCDCGVMMLRWGVRGKNCRDRKAWNGLESRVR